MAIDLRDEAELSSGFTDNSQVFGAASDAALRPSVYLGLAIWAYISAKIEAAYETLDALLAINTQTGTSYTLALTDKNKVVEMNNASANTVTVPPNSDVAFEIGTRIDVVQYGAGTTTIVAGVGVTLRAEAGALTMSAQYAGAALYKRATDEWVVLGGLVP